VRDINYSQVLTSSNFHMHTMHL